MVSFETSKYIWVCSIPDLKKQLLERMNEEVSLQTCARAGTGRLQKNRAGMCFEPGEISWRARTRPGRSSRVCDQILRRSSMGRLKKSANFSRLSSWSTFGVESAILAKLSSKAVHGVDFDAMSSTT